MTTSAEWVQERLIAKARADALEEAAKIAEKQLPSPFRDKASTLPRAVQFAHQIAAAIRALSEEK